MRLSNLTATLTATSLVHGAAAHPGHGMSETFAEIRARADGDTNLDSDELIGDLATLPEARLSKVGRTVKDIIVGDADPESRDSYFLGIVPSKGSWMCKSDPCCIWKYIANDMEKAFRGESGRCTDLARGAVRLGFHDAAGWSKPTAPGGGADGSIILAAEEITRPENNGLQEIIGQTKKWHDQYKGYGVSMADVIQMGANVATVVCPLGPRIRSFVGRHDSSVAAPDGLLPDVNESADNLIKLFEDKTIKPHGLTALIGAHTTSQQRFVDPSRAGDPQDSTPGVWDVKFYTETLGNAPARVFKFASDLVLSSDDRIRDEFKEFAGPGGQEHWNEDYAREYVRLSLLGVYNINDMTECSKVLPKAVTFFVNKDQSLLDKWLATTKPIKEISEALLSGKLISGVLGGLLGGISGLFSKWW